MWCAPTASGVYAADGDVAEQPGMWALVCMPSHPLARALTHLLWKSLENQGAFLLY